MEAGRNPFGSLERTQKKPNDRQIPIIIRNQGIRLGAAAIGKTLTVGGAATVAYGARVYRKPSTTRTDLFITKKDVKKKVTRSEFKELKKRHRFMPSNDRAQQRWVEKSVRAQGRHTDTPKARGRTIMRSGTAMIGVGRAIPTMAMGWIAMDATQRAIEGERIQDQPIADTVMQGWNVWSEHTRGTLGFALATVPTTVHVVKTTLAVLT